MPVVLVSLLLLGEKLKKEEVVLTEGYSVQNIDEIE